MLTEGGGWEEGTKQCLVSQNVKSDPSSGFMKAKHEEANNEVWVCVCQLCNKFRGGEKDEGTNNAHTSSYE